ncbi:MAG: DUF1501 domain-containing protein, partial [Pirellulaceae bacterium]
MAIKNFCQRTRREFLWQTGAGFTGTALAGMLSGDGFLTNQAVAADGATPWVNPAAPKKPHFEPKATAVIFLYMYGGPSHIDTFDYKPKMKGMDNKTVDVKTFGRGGHKNQGRIVETPWNFKQYGECGQWVSDLFPHLASVADEMTVINSMVAESANHTPATFQQNTGFQLNGFPVRGSWISYGLGSETEDLPAYVVLPDSRGYPAGGTINWSNGFLPSVYQGVAFNSQGTPIPDLFPPEGINAETDASSRELLAQMNQDDLERHGAEDALLARIRSHELAARMQLTVPEVTGLQQETSATKEMYGLNRETTADFGN